MVVGVSIRALPGCEVDLVRRWPGFPKLEAYQRRLSRYVIRRSCEVFDSLVDVHFVRLLEDYLEDCDRLGGVL